MVWSSHDDNISLIKCVIRDLKTLWPLRTCISLWGCPLPSSRIWKLSHSWHRQSSDEWLVNKEVWDMKTTNATSKSRLLTSGLDDVGLLGGFQTTNITSLPQKHTSSKSTLGAWELRWTMKKKHVPSHCLIWTVHISKWLGKFRSSNTNMHTTWLQEKSWIYIISMWQSMKSERVTSRFPWSHPMSLVANKSCHLATPQ